jgi:hypothetical protein
MGSVEARRPHLRKVELGDEQGWKLEYTFGNRGGEDEALENNHINRRRRRRARVRVRVRVVMARRG